MYKIILLIVFPCYIFANSLMVKDGDAKITINSKEFTMSKSQTMPLKDGDNVCIVSSTGGRVIINEFKQLNQNGLDCFQVPIKNESIFSSLLTQLKGDFSTKYIVPNEKVKFGTSTRDPLAQEDRIINLDANYKELIISGENEMKNSLKLTIYHNDSMIKQYSSSSLFYFFRIDVSNLKNNSILELSNEKDEILVIKKIVLQ